MENELNKKIEFRVSKIQLDFICLDCCDFIKEENLENCDRCGVRKLKDLRQK